MRIIAIGAFVALAAVLCLNAGGANARFEDPKYTIKQVMKSAHKDGLLKKVIDGGASDDDKKQLVEYYTALGQNTPPKGDADSWKKATSALVDAAKSGDADALKKASNCAACHKEFKK